MNALAWRRVATTLVIAKLCLSYLPLVLEGSWP
jgi:hypothetical protein